jgi:hypothetical protein
MPTLTIQHVSYHPSYPTLRVNRDVSNTGGFTLLDAATSVIEANHQFVFDTNLMKQTLIKDGRTYTFSFVNITGLAGGPLTWIDHSAAPKPAMTGIANITARIVYLPEILPVNPTGNGGAWIDAFDESTGSLVNNDFVTVYPGTQNETDFGNNEGHVPGAEEIEKYPPPTDYNIIKVTAYPHITHDADTPGSVSATFVEWVNMNPGTRAIRPGGDSFIAPRDHTSVMLAFYKSVVFRAL